MSLSAIPKPLRNLVFARDKGRCQYCHLCQRGQGSIFHINHVVPKSKGGETKEENLVLQCPHCSMHKSNKMTLVDAVSGKESGLFHPLRDEWEKHFVLVFDGTCRGTTPVGRVTVRALEMNRPIILVARLLQIRQGLLIATVYEN